MSGKQNLNIVDGDLRVSGTVHAAGVNSADMTRVVSKIAATEGSLVTIESDLGDVSVGVDSYINDTPPTNNITGLEISFVPNSDGSINIEFSFNYVQGAVEADGFLIYYKSDLDAPGEIDYTKDPSKFVPWHN
jgi:hypothetical protein